MSTKPLFIIALYLSALGLLLSGYLTYYNYFSGLTAGCGVALISCGGVNPVKIAGISQCVYGLAMFTATTGIALAGLYAAKVQRLVAALLGVGLLGTLFAGALSAYELWWQIPRPTTMPSCVYGFFLYLGILIAAALARNEVKKQIFIR